MESQVIDTRERQGFTYRLRRCKMCGFEYVTHEKYVGPSKKGFPRILFLGEAQYWTEAVWLEYRTGKLTATSISGMTESMVYFGNGSSADRKTCLHEWRIWNRKPSEQMRREEAWQ